MKDKNLAILIHLSGFICSFVVPLILWAFLKSPQRPLLTNHGKEAVNFQISLLIYITFYSAMLVVTSGLFMFKATGNSGDAFLLFGSGLISLFVIITAGLLFFYEIFAIIMAVNAASNEEEDFRYPLSIRFLK